MDRNSASLYLSVITIAAIEDGIAKNRWDGASRKAQRLSEWLEVDLHTYAVKVLLIDLAVARHIGSLSNLGRGQGRAPGFVDLAIAALAQRHG